MNNDYDQNYQSVQYAQEPMYGSSPIDPEIEELTGKAFGKGLAAAIMAWFPVASIIAIFFGSKAVRLVAETREKAAWRGRHAPGKLIPAKTLGMVGKIGGIVMTALWAVYAVVYLALILLMIYSRT